MPHLWLFLAGPGAAMELRSSFGAAMLKKMWSARRGDSAGATADSALFVELKTALPADGFKANAVLIAADSACFACGTHPVRPAVIIIGG